jgi:hypothetical protein
MSEDAVTAYFEFMTAMEILQSLPGHSLEQLLQISQAIVDMAPESEEEEEEDSGLCDWCDYGDKSLSDVLCLS